VLLLAFDTATPAVTAALHDGSRVLAADSAVSSRRHGELLAAMIERVLADGGATRADLEAVAVGTGPGPYTGLRAGLITARVLGSALGVPAIGVCTLDVIARAAAPAVAGREFIVATDALRKEVYWARYDPPRSPRRARSRGRDRCSTRSWAATRSRRATPKPRTSPRSRCSAWRSTREATSLSRCTCAGPMPGSPGRRSG
jgi:tRNA threonylcarbamoyl adenosine modification protein YeaZ